MCIVGGLSRLEIYTLKYSNNNQIKSFINTPLTNGYRTFNSSTIIDNIFLNNFNTPFKNGYLTLNSATMIDHKFHNNFINREISTGIVKASVSDLFSISISNRK